MLEGQRDKDTRLLDGVTIVEARWGTYITNAHTKFVAADKCTLYLKLSDGRTLQICLEATGMDWIEITDITRI